jgi:hypothetical protein
MSGYLEESRAQSAADQAAPEVRSSGVRPAGAEVAQSAEIHQLLGQTPGRPLGDEARGRAERSLGLSLGDVQLKELPGSAQQLGFVAATDGESVAFAEGAYRAGDGRSEALLGHELVHVAQHRGAGRAGPEQALEREADAAAGLVAAGVPVAVGLAAPAQSVQLKGDEPPSATVYVGINTGAEKELSALKKSLRRVKKHKLLAVMDDPDLEGKSGLDFLDKMKAAGLDPMKDGDEAILLLLIGLVPNQPQFAPMVGWLRSQEADFKDTATGLIKAFFDAEHGAYNLERLVLSGHSDAEIIYGEAVSSGSFEIIPTLQKLATFFPGAGQQVQDVMVSACFCMNPALVVQLAAIFPNVETIWAYQKFSPSAKSGGSLKELKRWEKLTRGDKQIRGGKKGVATLWSRADGVMPQLPPLDGLLAEAQAWYDANWGSFFNGTYGANDGSEVRAFYTTVQLIIGHTDTPDGDREVWRQRRNAALRLRKWDSVATNFGNDDRVQDLVEVVYEDKDATLDRIWALADDRPGVPGIANELVGTINDVATDKKPVPGNRDKTVWTASAWSLYGLYMALWSLDPKTIPVRWCI